jgi:predicted CXXCH cytochrome family protein
MIKNTVIFLSSLCLFMFMIQASSVAQDSNSIPIRTATDKEDSSIISIRTRSEPPPVIKNNECLGCHDDSYDRALSNPYQHSIVKSKCEVCHIIPVTDDDARSERIADVEDKHGPGLVSERYLSIDSCYGCHASNSSHPVDIKIRGKKMNIPDDLPTIEGGVITCLTCHLAHGGVHRYYTRFDSDKEICMKCHDSKYDRER